MLDAYIIDRIRREQEESPRRQQIPLHIERPPPEPVPPEDHRDDTTDPRGSVVIDYQL